MSLKETGIPGNVCEGIPMLDELKDLIIHNLDVVEFLDILGYDLADIVDLFDDEIMDNRDTLLAAVQ